MITADYHVHSDFSSDSTTPMESQIEQAIALGLERICFTDHMDYDFPQGYPLTFEFNPDEYHAKLDHMKEQYKDKIKILKGVELGLRPYLAERYQALMNQYNFDFAIGSSHLVNQADPFHPTYWEGITEQEGITRYFQSILDNLTAFHDFDVYGHLDYVVRYAPTKNANYSYAHYKEILDQVLTTIIKTGKGIEINTSGFKYGLEQPHPKADIIKRYLDLGGTIITIGSDAHKPEHLTYDFAKATNLLLSLGLDHYTIFENRQPIFIKL